MKDPGLFVWSYKTIYSLWLFLLGLGVHGRGPALHQGWFSPAPSLGEAAGHPKAQGSLRSDFTCWLLDSFTEVSLAVQELLEGGF